MKTIVFLGPSLNINKAKEIFPDAYYLPPVKCGDILRALRLKPQVIAIIDGYFEKTAAVWHKEILFAIESGVEIYGASSMGALRASELVPFGMHGVGEVFRLYETGEINDDDEVALIHGSAKSGYIAQSDAMVNVRATIQQALKNGILDFETAQKIIEHAKNQPYQIRSLNKTLQDISPVFLEQVMTNFVDQKQLDAIELLQQLKFVAVRSTTQHANKSIFLRALHNDAMCRPFHVDDKRLPIEEQVALSARLLGDSYRFLRRLAYLWSAINAIAHARQDHFDGVIITENFFPEVTDPGLAKRLALVNKFLNWQKSLDYPSELNVDYFLTRWARLTGDYKAYETPERYNILYYSALFWRAVEIESERYHLVPCDSKIQEFFDQFRFSRKFFSQKDVEDWMATVDFDFAMLTDLMTRLTRFHFLVMQNNLDALEVFQDNRDNVWWLLDVMRLTGAYELAERILSDKDFKRKICEDLQAKKAMQNDSDAYGLDFFGGFQEFNEYAK